MKIVEADWDTLQRELGEIRHAVFVAEQQVPEELEWDGEDPYARHWLAYDDDGQPVGTARLTRSGQVGRMAVLPEHRGRGIGSALLKAIVKHARRQDRRELFLHAQQHAIGFYERAGFVVEGPEFMDAGIPHRVMRLILRDALRLGTDAGRRAVADPHATACSLISQCRLHLRILSDMLEPDIYDYRDIEKAVSKLARLHRNSEVRMLITDSRSLAERGHRLLTLQQRLSTAIKIRVLDDDVVTRLTENFLVADASGLLVFKRREPEDRWADFNNRPIAENYISQFDELWNVALEDPRLRRLVI